MHATHPLLFAVTIFTEAGQLIFSRGWSVSREVVCAQVSITAVSMQTFHAPLSKLGTGVKILARLLAANSSAAKRVMGGDAYA